MRVRNGYLLAADASAPGFAIRELWFWADHARSILTPSSPADANAGTDAEQLVDLHQRRHAATESVSPRSPTG